MSAAKLGRLQMGLDLCSQIMAPSVGGVPWTAFPGLFHNRRDIIHDDVAKADVKMAIASLVGRPAALAAFSSASLASFSEMAPRRMNSRTWKTAQLSFAFRPPSVAFLTARIRPSTAASGSAGGLALTTSVAAGVGGHIAAESHAGHAAGKALSSIRTRPHTKKSDSLRYLGYPYLGPIFLRN
jgi:hypothetical protein